MVQSARRVSALAEIGLGNAMSVVVAKNLQQRRERVVPTVNNQSATCRLKARMALAYHYAVLSSRRARPDHRFHGVSRSGTGDPP
ncbi:hypothetical protein KCP74_06190 [Salmonella enterica subsp. enterica]|nr:hypothetical protein KCP74_06190 [Salmonella enterica subsp. enterica]